MSRTVLGSGWDRDAVLVDDVWVDRTARRPGADAGLRTEARLLPWLAERLPLPVPRPVVVGADPLTTRHRLLAGTPLATPTARHGAALGGFLRALHDVPLDDAVARGLPDPTTTCRWRDAAFDRFTRDVLARLADPAPLRCRLDRLRSAPATVLVHGDLRAEHVLLGPDDVITGVIDWGSARAGDPAKDLVWPLLDTGVAVAEAVVASYGADSDLRRRARDWRAVAPCYAVVHGLDTGDDTLVDEALAELGGRAARR